MILIADSGSTKTDWALVDDNGVVVARLKTQGLNPYHTSDESIRQTISEELSLPNHPDKVFFYGSGITSTMKEHMVSVLRQTFGGVHVEAESDLLGAARALLLDKPGIACILGTGANSCLYDGKRIVLNTPPLGYILGDEGSGAVLGKLFLNAIFKGRLSHRLKEGFLEWSGLTYADVIDKVYRQPMANRFLASIAPYLSKCMKPVEGNQEAMDDVRAITELVEDSFDMFFVNNITPYLYSAGKEVSVSSNELKVGFVGSIAYYFAPMLRHVFTDLHSLEVLRVVQSPLDGLAYYHSRHM